PSDQVERRRDQAQNPRENKRGSDRFPRRKADQEQKRRHGETTSANPGQAHGQRNGKSKREGNHGERSENVGMPHSSFLPPQRPERGLFGSSGSEVHGSQPMLL